MIDFLRSNPWCSREEYMWELSVPQITLASSDFTHLEYLMTKEEMEKERRNISITTGKDVGKFASLYNDLGKPIK